MDNGKLAIAYNVMRKNRAKKMAMGGAVENEKLEPTHESADKPMHAMSRGGMSGLMKPKSIAEMIHMKRMAKGGMADCYADGGEVDPPPPPETDAERAQKSMRKAFNFAEGGEVEDGEGDIDIDTQPDEVIEDNDFTANGPDAAPQDSRKKRRGLLISIMSDLHRENYGK